MHILLVKVQQTILDEKVDDLINHLTDGLEGAHLQIETKSHGTAAARCLCTAMNLMLDIAALQTDFEGYFRSFPQEAKSLMETESLPTDDHHHIYELLKTSLLNDKNHLHNPDKALATFAAHFPLKRAFLEPYFLLWQKVRDSKLPPSVSVVERLAYGVLNLLETLVAQGLLHEAVYRPTTEDAELLQRYNQNRIVSIDEALMEGNYDAENDAHNQAHRRIPCIKCGSYGPLNGYLEEQPSGARFIAYGFACNNCGMELFDQKDLLLAGIKPIYEIT